MKTIKVIYNNSTKEILDIVNEFQGKAYIELFNGDIYKEKGKVKVLQEDYGTKSFPFLVFEDENMLGVAAIWSESNPNWRKEINRILEK